MNETVCTNRGTRDDLLMAYLYDEVAPDERLAFDRHLAACAMCRFELTAFGGVRDALGQWAPPEPTFLLTAPASPMVVRPQGFWASLQQLPAWAQVAAAMLLLGVGAGFANLEVSYRADGLTVQTGWRHPAAVVGSPASSVLSANTQAAAPQPVPWAADVEALREELKGALDTRLATVAAPPSAGSPDAVLRRVQTLVRESEQRQQRELALRVAEIARDVQTQRQADLVKIDRSLGLMQSRTGMEVMRTQQQVNSLAQRVSQKP